MSWSTLISADALLSIPADKVIVVDCRHQLTDPEYGRRAYAAGHVTGARFFHLDEDLSGTKTGVNGRHPLPPADVLATKLAAAGIHNDTQVVAYDDAGGMYAARLWWLLRWLGHESVAVLDGGLAAYERVGGVLTTEVPVPVAGSFSIRPSLEKTVSATDILTADSHLLVLDARAPGRYAGEGETLDPVGGHIPGARNHFFQQNLDADGRFKSPDVLAAAFAGVLAGTQPDQVVNQCGSGVTACHNLLAMQYAGLPGAMLYPGSWSEWCADATRPVAIGPNP
ncbi:sulfurtransferase [Leeia oryzae]|uniref:sulfurtransferase n=1 Tax=Leeia oryzae TaxID=356662 RepID=UPI00035D08E6|nr:sulfurtransferase [Leeia oryzae]